MSIRVDRWSEPQPPIASELRRRMEAEGYTVTEHADEPGATYSSHDHPDDQSIWIISGSVELCVEGEHYTLNAGDRDYLPARTEHSAVAIGKDTVVYLSGIKN